MTMLEVDWHREHYGNDATPAVRCAHCRESGQLRWDGDAFVCRLPVGCAWRADLRGRGCGEHPERSH